MFVKSYLFIFHSAETLPRVCNIVAFFTSGSFSYSKNSYAFRWPNRKEMQSLYGCQNVQII